jgi:uncharacterized protein (TIGR03067 family)
MKPLLLPVTAGLLLLALIAALAITGQALEPARPPRPGDAVVEDPEPGATPADDFERLAGVWAEDPPNGDGRVNTLVFEGDKLGWNSMRYKDGEPLIGHTKGYMVELNPAARPKRITLTRGEEGSKDVRSGVYAVSGDTLKIALGNQTLVLRRQR